MTETGFQSRKPRSCSRRRNKGSRRPGVFVPITMSIVLMLVVSVFSIGWIRAESTSAACTYQEVLDAMRSGDSNTNPLQAASLAANSSGYESVIASLGPSVVVSFEGVFDLWHVDYAACSTHLTSVDAAYSLATSSGKGRLTIAENPTETAITNLTVDFSPLGGLAATNYQWSGYEVGPVSGYSITGTYAQWQNFGVSPTSGHCGAIPGVPGICIIEFWSGLTNQRGGGSGSGIGIAQSGIDAEIECTWVAGLYVCSSGYAGWYEFWAGSGTQTVCFNFSAGTDKFISEISWASPKTYYATAWDVTSGQACSAQTTMSMGAPNYGEFQAENAPTPVGGYYGLPHFNTWFNPAVARGFPLNLNSDNPGPPYTMIPGLTVDQILFNSGSCAGSGESCFEETA